MGLEKVRCHQPELQQVPGLLSQLAPVQSHGLSAVLPSPACLNYDRSSLEVIFWGCGTGGSFSHVKCLVTKATRHRNYLCASLYDKPCVDNHSGAWKNIFWPRAHNT